MRTRSVPPPWGQGLWQRVERLLDKIEDLDTEPALTGGLIVDGNVLDKLVDEARELKKEMLAEETRRAM